jgi:hypothetical protein
VQALRAQGGIARQDSRGLGDGAIDTEGAPSPSIAAALYKCDGRGTDEDCRLVSPPPYGAAVSRQIGGADDDSRAGPRDHTVTSGQTSAQAQNPGVRPEQDGGSRSDSSTPPTKANQRHRRDCRCETRDHSMGTLWRGAPGLVAPHTSSTRPSDLAPWSGADEDAEPSSEPDVPN